jgi:nicotinate-nucleotide adenylyltransferase
MSFFKRHLHSAHSNWLRPPGPIAPGMKIGLLGGSFNPAHEGHMHVSAVALKRLNLDYVWWLVTPQNPLKPTAGMMALHDRMTDARAVARHPRVIVLDLEHTLGTHYTIDTLKALKKRFPQVNFVWLMGSDNLNIFRRWHRWPDIAARVPIAVVTRPGTVLAALHAKPVTRFARCRRCGPSLARAKAPAFSIIDGPRNAQSATAIRARSAGGEAMVGAAPPW